MAYSLPLSRNTSRFSGSRRLGLRRFAGLVVVLSFVILLLAHGVHLFVIGGAAGFALQRVEENALFAAALSICTLILRGIVRGFYRASA